MLNPWLLCFNNSCDSCHFVGCLVCCDCQSTLTVKCYMRNGQPYCKDDFYKRFAKTKCANCELGQTHCLPLNCFKMHLSTYFNVVSFSIHIWI